MAPACRGCGSTSWSTPRPSSPPLTRPWRPPSSCWSCRSPRRRGPRRWLAVQRRSWRSGGAVPPAAAHPAPVPRHDPEVPHSAGPAVGLACRFRRSLIVGGVRTATSADQSRRERTMRYTLLIYTNEADRPQWGTPAGDAEIKGYDDFHGEVTKRGVLRGGEPLQRVADATSVRVRNGDTQISDGPAVQSPEQLGGWYLLECDDLDQALELAAKIPGASYGTIEVRPVLELSS
ncbi:MAG: YciI family protein [Propionibacteriaceae bacterium]